MSERGHWRRACWAGIAAALLIGVDTTWASTHYRLVYESTLTEQCAGCERPSVTYTLGGDLDIARGGSPWSTDFRFDNINFTTRDRTGTQYHITGSGSYSYSTSSPPSSWGQTQLSLHIDDGVTNRTLFFYRRTLGGGFPPWDVIYRFSSSQFDTNQNPTFSIVFTCAPVQEIWFSTKRSLTSAEPAIGLVQPGDVLSDSGSVVRRVTDLLQPFGVDPGVASGVEVDALSVAPGGELLFSLRQDLVDNAGHRWRHGDLLSAKGGVFRTNSQLLQNFGVAQADGDVGLDGVELTESGAILFSISTNVYSEKLGLMLTAGDLLSDSGTIVNTEQNLLSSLQPDLKDGPYGLAGFHAVGPMETWFCTEKGFQSALGPIAAGDILSTRRYVVFRNRDLVARFGPIDDPTDAGVGALFIIAPRDAVSPTLGLPMFSLSPAGVQLRWNTTARVSQVQAAAEGNGPYLPLSPIMTQMEWFDTSSPATNRSRFYRLQLW